jgi:hypothetical protein
MRNLNRYLNKYEGFNLRERLNIYAGMIAGPVLGTGLIYSFLSMNSQGTQSLRDCAINLGIAAVANIPLLLYEVCGGAAVGTTEAIRLQRNRRAADTNFDRLVDKEFKEANSAA